jgi:hypothetical protein
MGKYQAEINGAIYIADRSSAERVVSENTKTTMTRLRMWRDSRVLRRGRRAKYQI